MRVERRDYAQGTFTLQTAPWGFYRGARAMCSDGKVRTVARISETADTFFSVPAAVKVHGKTVSGFVTFETVKGSSVETEDDPSMVKFVANAYGKNAGELPRATWRPDEVDCFHCEGTGKLSTWDDELGEFVARYDDIACSWCDGRGRVSREDDRHNREHEAQRVAELSHP